MALPRALLFVLPLAAGALAWFLVVRERERPRSGGDEPIGRTERKASTPNAGLSAKPAPESVPVEPEPPGWIATRLVLPKGAGSLKGSELIAAVEAGGKVRLRGATEADLEALRRAVFEDVDRAVEQPYAAMMGWLKEAGFEVEVAYPTLTVRRRTDAGWTAR